MTGKRALYRRKLCTKTPCSVLYLVGIYTYYANGYSGVCIGFDMAKDEYLGDLVQKVRYTNTISKNVSSTDYLFQKGLEWSHEQEWRLVTTAADEYIPTTAITEIIIGNKMKYSDFENVIMWAYEHKLQVNRLAVRRDMYGLSVEKLDISRLFQN